VESVCESVWRECVRVCGESVCLGCGAYEVDEGLLDGHARLLLAVAQGGHLCVSV